MTVFDVIFKTYGYIVPKNRLLPAPQPTHSPNPPRGGVGAWLSARISPGYNSGYTRHSEDPPLESHALVGCSSFVSVDGDGSVGRGRVRSVCKGGGDRQTHSCMCIQYVY